MPSTGKAFSFVSYVALAVWTSIATMPAPGVAQVLEEMPAKYGFIWEGQISRSATPNDDAEWRWLRAQGTNTLITLDHTRVNLGKFGFEAALSIPFAQGAAPTHEQAQRFLKFVQDSDNQPAHLVSAGGHDRTALLSTLLRYAMDGKPIETAFAEARRDDHGDELSPRQEEWLRRWAMDHLPGSH